MKVRLKRLPHGQDLPLPSRGSAASAGLDLRAAVDEAVQLKPGARTVIPTGLQMALEQGWEGQVRPRSGRALKEGLAVLNSPGTIDADYRGEVGVILINLGQETIQIQRGDRIAQLLISRVPEIEVVEVSNLDEGGDRGSGGFGSTGR